MVYEYAPFFCMKIIRYWISNRQVLQNEQISFFTIYLDVGGEVVMGGFYMVKT